MDAEKVIDKLSKNAIVQSEISLQMQLGLPFLTKMGGELCICFKPHKTDYKDGKVRYFAPQYEIVWRYPFEHLVLFRNLACTDGICAETPVCEWDAQWMLDIGRHYMKELYDACTDVLQFRKECGMVSDVVLQKYESVWKRTIEKLELGPLYR